MVGSSLPLDDRLPVDGVVCFCHLRWSFVWQRPQHILTRLAARTDVVVVEEPETSFDALAPRLDIRTSDGVTILTPVLPVADQPSWGFGAVANVLVADLLEDYLVAAGWVAPGRHNALWYYTPMAMGAFPDSIPVDVTVYDVMDELANFNGAPRELKLMEQSLLRKADLVFTGGPSLFKAREGRHPDVSCFPSGVETNHFATARSIATLPSDVATLARPIIGFYGVLDERLDVELLTAAADQRPDWSFVLIGPVVKIDPATLPDRENLHFLGMRDYADLPAYLASFDVAMLPFAINEATRFISPTKTLEYLAGGAPVVSTPIVDVIGLYGDVVEIADGVDAFVAAIASKLEEAPGRRVARQRRAAKILALYEWDAIVQRMTSKIEATLAPRSTRLWSAPEFATAAAD